MIHYSDKFRKYFNSQNAALILFAIIAVSLSFNTFKVIQRNYELQQEVDRLKDEISVIEVQNQNLVYNIEYYKSEAYLNVEAKRRFNLAEKGEQVIFLPKDGEPEQLLNPELTQSTGPTDTYSNFDKWMIFFFGTG